MIDGRFDQHFIELFAGRGEAPAQQGPMQPPSVTGPLLLAAAVIGLALMACLPVMT